MSDLTWEQKYNQIIKDLEVEYAAGMRGARDSSNPITKSNHLAHAQGASAVLDKHKPDRQRNTELTEGFESVLKAMNT